jgi:hypothetical protein
MRRVIRCSGCGTTGRRRDSCPSCNRARLEAEGGDADLARARFSISETDDPAWVVVREPGARPLRMRRVDVEPCAVCGLRGHVAGDSDRCYQPLSMQLGGDQSEQSPMRRTA